MNLNDIVWLKGNKKMKFEIICDGAADLDEIYTQNEHITVVPFYVTFDGKQYLRERIDISIAGFYEQMITHADCFPKTSMPSVQDYIDAFTPFAQKNIPMLCICLTKKFSGSLQAAMNAKMAVEEEYENAEIFVLDSELATDLEGLFVQEAVRLRNMDLELQEAVSQLEKITNTGHIFFTTKDLKYLEHGGRIGKAASIAGSMLNIKPILHFADGELQPAEICRGRKKSLQKVIEKFISYLKERKINLKEYLFATGIGAEVPEYEFFQDMLMQRLKEEGFEVGSWQKMQIGSTIGVHTGPYPVGLGILKKCEI